MSETQSKIYGAIEAGGTKFICAVGSGVDDIRERVKIETAAPEKTLGEVIDFFTAQAAIHGPIAGLGVGAFGPIDINKSSPRYGEIMSTPKPGWTGVNIVQTLAEALKSSVDVDTDVNCALLGEASLGAGKDLTDVVYVTIGTGIGGGILAGGRILYGTSHPELGHMYVPTQPEDEDFEGFCPYHGNRCLEGVAAGPAIKKRWGDYSYNLPPEHPAWDLQARYLAIMCLNIMLMCAPQKIILGGGVMVQAHLFPMIRDKLHELMNGYGATPYTRGQFDDLIVPPALDGDQGIIGAFTIAQSK